MKGKGSNRGIGGSATRRRAAGRVTVSSKRHTQSSKKWLERQLNDPYVAAAREAGYRSRAAFKLIQLNEKFDLLKSGMSVVDLGAAPGGWTQVTASRIGHNGKIVALDILPMEPIKGAVVLTGDFLAAGTEEKLRGIMGSKADLVLSDMAPSTTGHAGTDHIRIMAMAELAAAFAIDVLKPDGGFVCKLFQGGGEKGFVDMLKLNFAKVRQFKPSASRKESSETYLIATGFRGREG